MIILDEKRKKSSILVSLITLKVSDGMKYNVGFVVSRDRKHGHLTAVINQREASNNSKLSKYAQSLFNSCFKNW